MTQKIARSKPTHPTLLARWTAIAAAGGAAAVARSLGYKTSTMVRLWYKDLNHSPSPEQARSLHELSGGVVKLSDILPSAYEGLKPDDLGWSEK